MSELHTRFNGLLYSPLMTQIISPINSFLMPRFLSDLFCITVPKVPPRMGPW